jgi:Helix-turn-helix domain
MNQPAPPSDPDQREGMSITDPTVMRALAHPVRMALIELFGVHATLTATQASEALGESPANCAFHLRTLAKYGFLEEAGGGRGRERPWKASAASLRIRLRSSDLDSEQARVAAGALEQVWYDRSFARIREAFVNRRWSPEWEEAAGSSQTLAFLTADELRTVRDEINAIVVRHLDERRVDPAQRPAGALPVEIVYFAYPRQDLAAQLPADAKDAKDANDTPA